MTIGDQIWAAAVDESGILMDVTTIDELERWRPLSLLVIRKIEAALAEERVRCAALVLTLKRLTDSAELLAHELADPGEEALDAIHCARAVLAGIGGFDSTRAVR